MEINVIKVGNSKGIRLPKAILDEYEIGETVEVILKQDHIEIRPKKQPRKDWENKLKELVNDTLEEELIPDYFEEEEL